MLYGRKIGVVVPAYNEEKYIVDTLKGIPHYVDKIVVIDDGSSDGTYSLLVELLKKEGFDSKLYLIRNYKNMGVGYSIAKGYKICKNLGLDIAVVMAGDGQMAPEDLPKLVEPIVKEGIPYVKGDRISYPGSRKIIPMSRYLGIIILTFLTRIITGYKQLRDSQSGYTALDLRLLDKLNPDLIYYGYGYPNDLLIKLSMLGVKVREVIVKPIYRDEVSGITPMTALIKIPFLILKGGVKKLLYSLRRKIGSIFCPIQRRKTVITG